MNNKSSKVSTWYLFNSSNGKNNSKILHYAFMNVI